MNVIWLVERHTSTTYDNTSETVDWHTVVLLPAIRYDGPSVATAGAYEAFKQAEYRYRLERTPPHKRKQARVLDPDPDDEISYKDWSFEYAPAELEEVVGGYLWQAADGSSVSYEVRRLTL